MLKPQQKKTNKEYQERQNVEESDDYAETAAEEKEQDTRRRNADELGSYAESQEKKMNRNTKEGKTQMNKVVLLGANHYNGLGLVRSFGVNGIRPYGIIIGERAKKSFVRKSKYWNQTWVVKDDKAAVKLLVQLFSEEKEKAVVIPWADSTAACLDENYNRLSKWFLLPSIHGKQGAIAELMNKQNLGEFMKNLSIEMLSSRIVECSDSERERNGSADMPYPVILKPVVSAEGEKLDITVCGNAREYQKALHGFAEKGYRRILVQQYLEEREEYVASGAVSRSFYSYSMVRNIRQWPKQIGCGSLAQFCADPPMLEFCRDVCKKLQSAGYEGMFDLEFFRDSGGKFYLNEMNWRSSGFNFVSLYTGVHSAFQYYCAVIGRKISGRHCNGKEGFMMNESTDLRHVVFAGLSFRQWKKDWKKTRSFALWYGKDPVPAIAQYCYLLKELVLHRRKG